MKLLQFKVHLAHWGRFDALIEDDSNTITSFLEVLEGSESVDHYLVTSLTGEIVDPYDECPKWKKNKELIVEFEGHRRKITPNLEEQEEDIISSLTVL